VFFKSKFRDFSEDKYNDIKLITEITNTNNNSF
jgi:hypothetical protein